MKNDARFLSLNILVQFESTKKQLGYIQNENFSKKKYQENTKSRAKVLSSEVVKLKGRLDYLIENISGRKIFILKKVYYLSLELDSMRSYMMRIFLIMLQ